MAQGLGNMTFRDSEGDSEVHSLGLGCVQRSLQLYDLVFFFVELGLQE